VLPYAGASLSSGQARAAPRDLHSFPTRRSSDLGLAVRDVAAGDGLADAGAADGPGRAARGRNDAGQRADPRAAGTAPGLDRTQRDRKSTRLNSSHVKTSYAVFCLKKKKQAR